MKPSKPVSLAEALGGSEAVVNLRPNHPFLLVHHQGREGSWEICTEGLDGPTWLPVFQQVPMVPGAGVLTREQGMSPEDTIKPLMDRLAKDRSVVIRPEDAGYLESDDAVDYRTKQTGRFWRLAWERVQRSAVPDTPDQVVLDHAAYNAWRLEVFQAGMVPPPSDHVLSAASRKVLARKARLAQVQATARDDYSADLARRQRDLEQARKPWVTAPPAPPKKRGTAAVEA